MKLLLIVVFILAFLVNVSSADVSLVNDLNSAIDLTLAAMIYLIFKRIE